MLIILSGSIGTSDHSLLSLDGDNFYDYSSLTRCLLTDPLEFFRMVNSRDSRD